MTTGQLARLLGVSPTTLRSWDRRYGLGPAVRANGRHRRWSPEDVAMMREMCRLTATGVSPAEAARVAQRQGLRAHPAETPGGGTPPAVQEDAAQPVARAEQAGSGLPLGRVRLECRGLARAAVRMDGLEVQQRLREAVAAHGPAVAWEEVMAPALRAVGRKWQSSGERYVEVEHLLSWHISATLRHRYVESATHGERHPPALPVMLSCPAGEYHTLPFEALAAVLADGGLTVLMLGCSVPADALMSTVQRVAPAGVALWSQTRPTADLRMARRVAAARWGVRGARSGSPVLLCGPGWRSPTDGGAGLLQAESLGDAVRVLTELQRRCAPGAPVR
ncbi:MerR family transcriptional regulator [Streptomyces sp. NPDC056580]|uniref:MerR family transcriptional regulator n=1 Tax=Streptomyces sp. NPDC056580 TaxID=3345872 RepID=UPI00369DB40F